MSYTQYKTQLEDWVNERPDWFVIEKKGSESQKIVVF